MRVGLIAGGGELPSLVAGSCTQQSIPFVYVNLTAKPPALDSIPLLNASLGAIGEILTFLKKHQVTHIVMAGHVERPRLTSLKLDAKGLSWMAQLGLKALGGDDALLKGIRDLLETEGFKVLAPGDFITLHPWPTGVVTARHPTAQEWADISRGSQLLDALSPWDIGQGLIVFEGYTLGVEAAEGTAGLIARCALLRNEKTGGVLVKKAKIGQTLAVDAPTIGPQTIEQLAKGRYAGLAICGQTTQVINPTQTLALANTHNLFMVVI
jgi:DUF1009 family protein